VLNQKKPLLVAPPTVERQRSGPPPKRFPNGDEWRAMDAAEDAEKAHKTNVRCARKVLAQEAEGAT
jgi:hypothetical protein